MKKFVKEKVELFNLGDHRSEELILPFYIGTFVPLIHFAQFSKVLEITFNRLVLRFIKKYGNEGYMNFIKL
jgi:hypothetical protein